MQRIAGQNSTTSLLQQQWRCCSVVASTSALHQSAVSLSGSRRSKSSTATTTTTATDEPTVTHTINRRFFDSLSKKVSPNAKHYNLVDQPTLRFTVRPAPSVVPPTLPTYDNTSSSPTSTSLPPALHPERSTATTSTVTLSPSQISAMRELRASNPTKWTRSALAKKYNCSPFFVGIVGFGDNKTTAAASSSSTGYTTTMKIADLVKEKHFARQDAQREKWGFKKRVDREVRRRRKDFW